MISNALSKLVNCHELEISEDYDLENRWTDPHLVGRLQNDNTILCHPSIWAFRSHSWLGMNRLKNIFVSLDRLLNAVEQSPTITHMTVDLDAGNLCLLLDNHLHDSYHNVQHFTLRLNSFPLYEEMTKIPELVSALADSCLSIYTCPGMYNLNIQVSFKSPSSETIRYLKRLKTTIGASGSSD